MGTLSAFNVRTMTLYKFVIVQHVSLKESGERRWFIDLLVPGVVSECVVNAAL